MEPPMKWMLPLAVSPRPARYAVAIGSAAIAAVLVEFLLPSVGNQFPFLMLYPAVICAAWYGGFGPGLLATVLTALVAALFLFEPRFSFAIARPADQLATSLFLVVGGFISWLGEMILRANRQLEKYARGIANQRDISEKRAAELDRLNESLRQSEGRYRSLAIATAQIVWTTNPEGEVVEDMPMWRAFTGKSEEELRGRGWVDSLHPEDRERTRAVWSEAVRARSFYETEYRIRKSDGEYRHFAARGAPVLQADGSVREWVGTCTDITARKRTEAELRQMSHLIDQAHDAILIRDMQGTIRYWNRGAEQMYGWSREEALGHISHDFLKTRFPVSLQELEDRLARDGSWEGELIHSRRDGAQIVVASRQVLDSKERGEPTVALEINSDITERKRSEDMLRKLNEELDERIQDRTAQLRDSEEQFRTLANGISNLCWMAKPDGWIFWYNQRWYEYTGTTPQDMEGWGWQSVHDPEALPKVLERWKASIASGEPFEMVFPLRSADGVLRPFLTRIMPVNNRDGTVARWFGTNTDITEQKQAEEMLRERTAQLEAANQELERFAYSVSHDLRAPLRAIDGFCQILMTEHAPGLDGEPRRYLQRVSENTRKMGRLIDDLLHFSRLGRQAMTRQPVAMADLVRQCLEELQGEREGREVEVILGELPPCRADAALLKQVWLNLLANALKFTRSRAVARIEAGSFARDGETVYFVRDNGVGFDMAYADKLFGVFQRLHRQEDYEGTGVGLALVQRIIHRHGGRVWAEAGPDRGAAFFFTLGRNDTDA